MRPLPTIRHHFSLNQAAPPATAERLVEQIHQGDLFVFSATPQSLSLVALARDCIRQEVGADWVAQASEGLCPPLPYDQVRKIRERIYAHPRLQSEAREIIRSFGLPEGTRVDTPRLRVITHGDEKNPETRAVYVVHRDTWYGCPQDQINWWMPLFHTPLAQAFGFFPRYFREPVPNTSQIFEYDHWMKTVGWHGSTDLTRYPQPNADIEKEGMVRFDFEAGDLLLFSAHHLHQTQPNPIPNSARWSLDFRSSGHQSASPNVDNLSRGAEERVLREFQPIEL